MQNNLLQQNVILIVTIQEIQKILQHIVALYMFIKLNDTDEIDEDNRNQDNNLDNQANTTYSKSTPSNTIAKTAYENVIIGP